MIAHGQRTILGPVSPGRLDALAASLDLAAGARVVEIGCGKAELLVRILRRWPGASAEGFDRNPWFLADARAVAEVGGVSNRLSLIDTDAPGARLAGRAVDLAIAIGASGIVGDGATTLAFLGSIVVPGGAVVFGDGVWTATPPAVGLAAFGMRRDELPDGVAGLTAQAHAAGLEPISIELVTTDEWDAYESAYAEAVQAWAVEHAGDPDRATFLDRAAMMRESYRAWRRGCMGFAIGRFRRP